MQQQRKARTCWISKQNLFPPPHITAHKTVLGHRRLRFIRQERNKTDTKTGCRFATARTNTARTCWSPGAASCTASQTRWSSAGPGTSAWWPSLTSGTWTTASLDGWRKSSTPPPLSTSLSARQLSSLRKAHHIDHLNLATNTIYCAVQLKAEPGKAMQGILVCQYIGFCCAHGRGVTAQAALGKEAWREGETTHQQSSVTPHLSGILIFGRTGLEGMELYLEGSTHHSSCVLD